MEILIVILLVALLGVVLFLFWDNRRQTEAQLEAQRNALNQGLANTQQALQQAISATQQSFGQRMEGLDQRLTSVQSSLSTSLSTTQDTLKSVGEQLGGLTQASQRILEVGQDISSLQDILRPPKLRGGLGELFLENALAQILPAEHYTVQHRFHNGESVDAVVRLGNGLVPVDSKFPLESFRGLLAAQTDEERRSLRRAFVRDVRGHVDAVAKYIRPDEETFDFALMYIPAENVYYETMVKDDFESAGESLATYAMQKHVVPVSPNSFYAYLQAIVLGLKGMRVEERAQEIVGHLQRLDGDFKRLRGHFETLGGHIDHAKGKYEEVDRDLGRFGDRLSRPLEAEWSELAPPEQPRLLDGSD